PENCKLLFGPYEPPPLAKGERTHCLYRDALVVVTSWSDGRISWPRCRALGHRGGSGLLWLCRRTGGQGAGRRRAARVDGSRSPPGRRRADLLGRGRGGKSATLPSDHYSPGRELESSFPQLD